MIIAISILFFAGIAFLLSRKLILSLIGILLIGNAVNLSIFWKSAPTFGAFAFINQTSSTWGANDPVPQALVLTAIVIGFALVAFIGAFLKRITAEYGRIEPSTFLDEGGDV